MTEIYSSGELIIINPELIALLEGKEGIEVKEIEFSFSGTTTDDDYRDREVDSYDFVFPDGVPRKLKKYIKIYTNVNCDSGKYVSAQFPEGVTIIKEDNDDDGDVATTFYDCKVRYIAFGKKKEED